MTPDDDDDDDGDYIRPNGQCRPLLVDTIRLWVIVGTGSESISLIDLHQIVSPPPPPSSIDMLGLSHKGDTLKYRYTLKSRLEVVHQTHTQIYGLMEDANVG